MAPEEGAAQRHEGGPGGPGLTSKARATVHGAISIVNAVATGMGATMGTDQQVTAVVEASPGRGVELLTGGGRSRFISKTVEGVVPAHPKQKQDRDQCGVGHTGRVRPEELQRGVVRDRAGVRQAL